MDFGLTEQQQLIRNMTRKFVEKVVAPRADEMEATGEYPYDLMAQMSELGMMGIPFPEEYGGSGGDWVSMNICIDELCRGDVSLGILLDVTTLVAEELFQFGTEDQKQKWLTPIARGERIGAFGLTEPEAGSDAGATKTTATVDGDHLVVNGTKQFITNIGFDNASIVIITARTRSAGKDVVNTIIMPKGTHGFTLGKKYDKLALSHSATHECVFEDCRVPLENFLGTEGKGFSQHLAALQTGRISVGACCVGLAQACFDAALKYAKERMQFGQPIYNFQGVSFKLADMAMQIELARTMVLKAAWLKDNNMPHTLEASYAKLFASEMCEKCASDAVQIHGGYGFMNDYPVSRYYKQCKVFQIVEGTSEIQRMVISRNLD